MIVHVLDGTYELFRAYFAFPRRQAPDGMEVGAVVGLVETTLAYLRDAEVAYGAVATDTVIESFRNELFEGYKTSEGVDPELLAQFPLAEEALRALGLVVWGMVEFEADDAMATAAARWRSPERRIRLVSPDKDLAQCVVDGEVVTYDRRRGIEVDEAGVREKFGVGPASIPDYLALVGDSADGIPGLPGWGPKSAATVLAVYEHLEAIPPDPEDWAVKVRGARRLAEVLRERWEDALLYRLLATLRTDVPLAEELEDLRWTGVPRDAFEALCDRLGVTGLRTRPHRWREPTDGRRE